MDWNSAFFATLLHVPAIPEVAPPGVLRNPDFITGQPGWETQSGWALRNDYLVATDTVDTFAYQRAGNFLVPLPDTGTATCALWVPELTSGGCILVMNNTSEAAPTLNFGLSEPGYYEITFPLAPGDKTLNFLSKQVDGAPLNARIKFINLFVH